MLRYALLANGNFAHWTELLERTAREPGRPQQKLVKARLLCELFKVMAPNAQCTFIARVIEPRLDAGLAQRWRKRERIHAHTRRLRAKFKRTCALADFIRDSTPIGHAIYVNALSIRAAWRS